MERKHSIGAQRDGGEIRYATLEKQGYEEKHPSCCSVLASACASIKLPLIPSQTISADN